MRIPRGAAEDWSFPIAFAGWLLLYFLLDYLASMADLWTWLERFSWIAALASVAASLATLAVAIWLGLPQLRQIREEQRRLADEQARRPYLRVGFDSLDRFDLSTLQELTISPQWPTDRNHSHAVTLVVSTLNLGTKSARDLFWTFVFEGFTEQGQVLSPHGEPMYPVIQPGTAEDAEPLKLVPDPHGWVRLVSRLPYLHPGTWQKYGFTIYVPKGQRSVNLMVLVAAADIPFQQVDLTVNVDEVRQ